MISISGRKVSSMVLLIPGSIEGFSVVDRLVFNLLRILNLGL